MRILGRYLYIGVRMTLRRILTLLMMLTLTASTARAQSISIGRYGDRYKGSATGTSSGMAVPQGMAGGSVRMEPSVPSGYGKYEDDGLDALEKEMQEREWGHEDTAWKRASEMDSIEGYQTYLARYPYGAHAGDANNRIIDLRVQDALNGSHEDLPDMKRVEEDDDSPTSTILVENNTGYPLTVMYSGLESKSIVIAAGGRGAVTVKNGHYRIAASVPPGHIRPFAGSQDFSGGRYEVGFWVVRM